jgi:leader peptidase (prepilin peptidase)/N-methyltransferase
MSGAHQAVLAGFAFAVGASVGSFLNVCAWRLPRGESLVRPPSRCPRCGSAIAARDNLPVLGWLWLRGRCRSCSAPISARYPLVESAVGLLFAAVLLAETAAGPLDPLDLGPLAALARVGYHWALVALLVTAALIEHDRRSVLPLSAPFGPVGTALPPDSVRSARLDMAAIVALSACLFGEPVGAGLNLALLAVFLRGAAPDSRAVPLGPGDD